MKQGMFVLSIVTLLLLSGSTMYELSNSQVAQFTEGIELEIDVCTYLGGAEDDRSWSIAVDSEDNIYITGYTESADFPASNPLGCTLDSYDVFISKFSSAGELIYSTRVGGSSSDKPSSIEVDALGNVYVAGITYSQDFPIVNGYDSVIEPGNPPFTYGKDGFILKLNSTGNGIVFSTYLGGSDYDEISDLAIDLDNNVYVVGGTSSSDFPITGNAFDKSYEHFTEGFVTKLSSNGQSAIYSSFVGAEDNEHCEAIALDSSNNMYIVGTTQSAGFPTKNAYSTAFSDDQFCCFVLKLSNTGTLDYSTHVGGTAAEFPDGDSAQDIVVDSNGNAYVAGVTDSEDFPLVNEFVDTVAANQDGFIFKLSSGGNSLLYSSYIGGHYTTAASNLAVNDMGEVCLLGFTYSDEFTAIGGNSTYGGGMGDGIFYLLSANGTPVYSSYLGWNDSDTFGDVVIDSTGRLVMVGYSRSTNPPITNAYDETFNGDPYDVILLVLSYTSSASTTSATSTSPTSTLTPVTGNTPDMMFLIGGFGIASVIVILVLVRKRSPSTVTTSPTSYEW
ncbi:MAG: SBBP repeat-containing protein [Candidatus Thorarchaeota archaeon]